MIRVGTIGDSKYRWFLDDVYNTKRIHSSLGYLTPAEFEQRWLEMPRTG